MPLEHKFNIKDFNLVEEGKILGFSKEALREHLKLYRGYVNKWNEIIEKLKSVDKSKAAATYSEFGELKRQESFNANGVFLHEIFFNVISNGNGIPTGEIVEKIKEDFGSFENWKEDFIATAMSSRGWALLVLELSSKKLFNVLVDFHNIGYIVNTIIILVLDVFEHAYFMDYGTDRKKYIENFLKTINWDYVEKRYQFAKKVLEIYEKNDL